MDSAYLTSNILSTQGGSLRVYACHANAGFPVSASIAALRDEESRAKLDRLATYEKFQAGVEQSRRKLTDLLAGLKRSGKSIAAYGAAAKGNTLLNYCGIRGDTIDFVVDRSPHKQGKYLPGSHLPVRHPDAVRESKPDYLLILPWNLTEEITQQMAFIREWGGQFIVPDAQPESTS